jgi:hypothetical protein
MSTKIDILLISSAWKDQSFKGKLEHMQLDVHDSILAAYYVVVRRYCRAYPTKVPNLGRGMA